MLPPPPLCGVCVVRGHFAFASCGILRTSCRLSRHAKTCPRSSATPPPLPRFSPVFCVISCRRRRHKVLPAHTHIALQLFLHFSLRQLAAKVAAFHLFLLSMPHSTPPTAAAATRSQLGLVIHTKRHELVVVTVVVVVAVVVVTVVAVVSVAAVAVAVLLLIFCSLACD